MEVRIINETKDLIVTLITEQEFINRYGDFTVADFATRKYVAETDDVFVLYGMSGFRQAPNVNDIRNETINANGTSRVSGHSEDISLDIQLEPLIHCFTNEQMLDLYNYPLSTFHNEFDDLLIEFDLGCAVLYQYYSFQSQSDDLGIFSFQGSRGGNTYYIKGGVQLNMLWEQDMQYMTPALIKPSTYISNNNYVNDKPLHNRVIEYVGNIESIFTFTVETVNYETFPKSFIDGLNVKVNENTVLFKGKFQKISLDANGVAYNEDGDIIEYEGDIPVIEKKKNTIIFSPQLQRGDFKCNMIIPTATMF